MEPLILETEAEKRDFGQVFFHSKPTFFRWFTVIGSKIDVNVVIFKLFALAPQLLIAKLLSTVSCVRVALSSSVSGSAPILKAS